MISFIILAQADGGGALDMARDTAETFGLNWWLFLSQCISFWIVSFLLYKFAYQPVLAILEERREKIAEGLRNAESIKKQLAEAEATSQKIIGDANTASQKLIEEGRAAAKKVQEKETQRAIAEAEQIISRANDATRIEREKMMIDLRREVSRLVVDTTAKVTGKVLNIDDQKRLSEEASRELAA